MAYSMHASESFRRRYTSAKGAYIIPAFWKSKCYEPAGSCISFAVINAIPDCVLNAGFGYSLVRLLEHRQAIKVRCDSPVIMQSFTDQLGSLAAC